MATAIEWTDKTWNPATGCDRVSPGCAYCYALDLAARLKLMGQARYQRDGGRTSGPGFGVTLHPDKLKDPLRWRKPCMVFVNSMSDLFHEEIPVSFIYRVFEVMLTAKQHTFQVLTKRPERMRQFVQDLADSTTPFYRPEWPAQNVWLGVSIENRRFVHRAELLRQTPAAVRFISAEPLLGPLVPDGLVPSDDVGTPMLEWRDWADGCQTVPRGLDLTSIDWLIVGGESGSKRRMRLEWARDLRKAATAAGTAFFMKQLGGVHPGNRLEELPEDLRIREYPESRVQEVLF